MATDQKIKYHAIDHEKYKYELDKDYSIIIGIQGKTINEEYIALKKNGELTVKQGYLWDGPTDPAPDWECLMRASLIHDALYQLMREKKIGQGWRRLADRLFKDMSKEDGLPDTAAEIAYWALRTFAGFAAKPEANSDPVLAMAGVT